MNLMKMTIGTVLTIILSLLLIYAIFSYVRMRRLVQVGVDLANSAIAYEQSPENPEQSFIVFGDSSAVGTGASKPQESTAGRLGTDYPNAHITNKAVNGLKSAELVPIIQDHAGERYDLVLIQIGGNDIVRYTNLETVEQSINSVLIEATQLSDNVVLLTAGNVGTAPFFPFGTRWAFTKRTRKVRDIIMTAANTHDVHYVDLFREKEDDPFAQDTEKYYAEDSFHPSSEGYADWYEYIQKTLQDINL